MNHDEILAHLRSGKPIQHINPFEPDDHYYLDNNTVFVRNPNRTSRIPNLPHILAHPHRWQKAKALVEVSKPEFVFRCWSRDNPQDGRCYFDIWKLDGEPVSQRLVPKGEEDAYMELVETHAKAFPEQYRLTVNI